MPRVKYDLPEKVPELIALGLHVSSQGTANAATLTNPSPTPGAVLSATQALETANTAAGTHAKGTVDARDPSETTLRNVLHQWGAYLEKIAATMPGQEAMVYAAGGFDQRATPKRVTPLLKLTQPGAPGTAHAQARAPAGRKKAYYNWRLSLNGGQTWLLSGTNDSRTDFSGIPSGTLITVEYSTTVKNVTSAWIASATLLVK
jgi:hypothetical protein